MAKQKENAVVASQEQLADGIYSMWIQTQAADTAKPGQFISMYTTDGSKLLPRPISICDRPYAGNASGGLSCDRRKYRNGAVFKAEIRGYDPGDRTAWEWIPVRKSRRKESLPDGRRNRCTTDSGAGEADEV